MTNRKPISLLTAIFTMLLSPGHAADEGLKGSGSVKETGSVSGRVQNVVTGNYLNKARITVKGTDQIAYTDEFGTFRLVSVQPGPVVLEVFYTDLDPQEIPLAVQAGKNVNRDIALTNKLRYRQSPDIVKLDPYLVSSNRETDTQAIANNEQRFAPNIKNVVATNSLGDVLGSSAGDFLKSIPGLTAEYDNADVAAISIRGIGGGLTVFQNDGAPIVSGGFTSTRTVEMRTLALNNISRMEVTKVPTPSTPADALAGSVNMISKNAFERSKAEFRYGVNLIGNSPELDLNKTPHAYGDKTARKVIPGFDFDYTCPIGKNFGIVLTGMQSDKFNIQHILQETYNPGGTSTGASIAQPYLQTFRVLDAPRTETRAIYTVKADWRVTPNSILSVGGVWSRYVGMIGNESLSFTLGSNGTPTVVGGLPLTFGPTFANGATGRGSITSSGGSNIFVQGILAANLAYRYDDGKWRLEVNTSRSRGSNYRDDFGHGHFLTVSSTTRSAVRINFLDTGANRPATIQVFDANNNRVDFNGTSAYRMSTAADTPFKQIAGITTGNLNLRRRIDVFSFPAAIQAGGAQRIQTIDAKRHSDVWTFTGSDDRVDPYRYKVWVNRDNGYGFRGLPGINAHAAFGGWQDTPTLFTQTPAQVVSAETYRIANSEYLREAVSAAYVEAELRLLNNRLNVLTGVRFEKTADEGQGQKVDPDAVYLRNPDGTFARTSQGARIRKPEAGVAGSIEQLRLTSKERKYLAERSYHGYYPSLHFTYNIKDNFLARLAYAQTYGRPDFANIIPNTTISEADLTEAQLQDPRVSRGNISVRNTGLKPWTAQNYDLSLEHYTDQGGVFSAGVFLKEIRDFYGDMVRVATVADLTALGLDPNYAGWTLSTKFNSGNARISGVELNARHSLGKLGGWGRYFTVFANATQLRLEGNPYASFTSIVPKTANWGMSFNWKRVSFTSRWNYRGLNKLTPAPLFGVDGFQYIKASTTLDLNVSFQLSKRVAIVGNVNNVFDVSQNIRLQYGSGTPAYARQTQVSDYGAACAIGLKGSF